MSNALEVKGLTKFFPGFALKDVSITLPTGCIMGFIGENGAGKSTALRLILGLLRPDTGSIQVLGKTDFANDRALKEHIGVVMDECGFPENLTLSDINAILRRCYRTWDERRFRSFATRFQLPERKSIKTFSRGMKMKLSIAAALSHDSRLLILDEATSGLDPIVRDEILDVFLDFIQDETHSILISSHILSDLEKICDYITFIHQGKILLSSAKDELLSQYAIAKGSAKAIAAIESYAVVGVRSSAFGAEALVKRIALPPDIVSDPATLEEIMLYFVKEAR
ncbi:MAG: ABC transporter ATP-binding protein [Clostridiales bacterium]|nr:ABC transporter ATP-binding protein [Clostridiales bacterium]MDO4350720.1 ABC transporter ATP-binding protein [Eubacteriales bacterium]MDY4008440.1 ABC transporter ATP-binding protein [Candidatus Limiplasma sp.]